ncbi:hypothetical protein GQ43DRAFT_468957 [Delitschia confertaspora ATCC 74209]|uniref:CFEM domain-containing protein n=1 Tax=Delitschia confertaspora ATCC 74209 TaxID=1513339 RepID=A0A9P4JXZ4_9PLEO|nr:hypothetical protein GQ43DRAFT_468957 [Delitschia confertaspora ATCC 74209]
MWRLKPTTDMLLLVLSIASSIHPAASVPQSSKVVRKLPFLGLPRCSLQCVISALGSDSCIETDFRCHCTNLNILNSAVSCLKDKCEADEQEQVTNVVTRACKAAGIKDVGGGGGGGGGGGAPAGGGSSATLVVSSASSPLNLPSNPLPHTSLPAEVSTVSPDLAPPALTVEEPAPSATPSPSAETSTPSAASESQPSSTATADSSPTPSLRSTTLSTRAAPTTRASRTSLITQTNPTQLPSSTTTPLSLRRKAPALSSAAKVGIAVSVAILLALLLFLLNLYIRRLKRDLRIAQAAADVISTTTVREIAWRDSTDTVTIPAAVRVDGRRNRRRSWGGFRNKWEDDQTLVRPQSVGGANLILGKKRRGQVLSVVVEQADEEDDDYMGFVREPVPGQREGLVGALELDGKEALVVEAPLSITPKGGMSRESSHERVPQVGPGMKWVEDEKGKYR